jgi:hypothetical protein
LHEGCVPVTIIPVSEYACMIVGLKYAGGTDGFPIRINVGDVVALRRETRHAVKPGGVAAYHNGKKVGYLASDKQALWKALSPSARGQARVIGEILDEDGEIVGLDVKIATASPNGERTASPKAGIENESPKRSFSIGRGAIALGTLFFTLATIAQTEEAGPERGNLGMARPMPDAERIALHEPRIRPEAGLHPKPADQVVHLTVPYDPIAEKQEHVGELSRKVQFLAAHRLSAEHRLLSEAVARAGYFEARAEDLARKLRETEEAAAQHQQQVEDLKRNGRDLEAQWQARYHKLTAQFAALLRSIGRMETAQQLGVEEKIAYNELRESNRRELAIHTSRLTAWKQSEPELETGQNAKPAVVSETVEEKGTASAPSLPKADKKSPSPTILQVRKKANFSRYTQNPDPSQSSNR